MTKEYAMQPLVNLAHQRNDACTRRVGQLNQQQLLAQNKLNALLEYRKDYQIRFQQLAASGVDQGTLNNFQDFIKRLDDAIAQQKIATNLIRDAAQIERVKREASQRTMQSFDTLAQRHYDGERRVQDKIEQRSQDEYAGRRFALKVMASNEKQ